MPFQRTDSAIRADQRSAFPSIPGVPGWVAVLIAVTATLIGFGIDAGSGSSDLGTAFAACYILGCVAAVLAVRHSGIFTAVIQPPLLLFAAVPLGYYFLHGSPFEGLKDLLIGCGYPLVERFPLMLFTAAGVLLIGLGRWYLDTSAPSRQSEAEQPATPGRFSGMAGRLSSAFAGGTASADESGARQAAPRHTVDRSARSQRDGGRAQRRDRPAPERSHRRRPEEDMPPRTRRSTAQRAVRDDPPPQRRRPRPPQEQGLNREQGPTREQGLRTPPPGRRDPRDRREAYQPRATRPAPARDEPPYPPRARPTSHSRHSATHHPVSRVRYRASDVEDADYPESPRRRPDPDRRRYDR
jgi:hypothetical protein